MKRVFAYLLSDENGVYRHLLRCIDGEQRIDSEFEEWDSGTPMGLNFRAPVKRIFLQALMSDGIVLADTPVSVAPDCQTLPGYKKDAGEVLVDFLYHLSEAENSGIRNYCSITFGDRTCRNVYFNLRSGQRWVEHRSVTFSYGAGIVVDEESDYCLSKEETPASLLRLHFDDLLDRFFAIGLEYDKNMIFVINVERTEQTSSFINDIELEKANARLKTMRAAKQQ